MFEAARLADPIAHSSALAGFLAGAVLGIALIAAVAFATFTCGFGVALLAGLAAGMGAGALLGLGETIGRMFSAPSGALLTGARNVYVNSRLSALATASTAACSKHNPVPVVAEGSTNVFIHGLPAARQGDALTCGAKIDAGSPDTFIGGGRVGYLPVDDEVPAWLRTTVDWSFALAGLVGSLAGLLKAAGGITRAALPCAARFTAGFVLGEAAGRYVIGPAVSRVFGGLFGHPVDVSTGRKLLLASDELDFVLPGALPGLRALLRQQPGARRRAGPRLGAAVGDAAGAAPGPAVAGGCPRPRDRLPHRAAGPVGLQRRGAEDAGLHRRWPLRAGGAGRDLP